MSVDILAIIYKVCLTKNNVSSKVISITISRVPSVPFYQYLMSYEGE